jgi:hypothetical protein
MLLQKDFFKPVFCIFFSVLGVVVRLWAQEGEPHCCHISLNPLKHEIYLNIYESGSFLTEKKQCFYYEDRSVNAAQGAIRNQ